jgi:HAD superfamily hydrolase (TIGR01457 family)
MALADAYGCLLLDLDGVLYRGDEPVPGAPQTMAAIRERGMPLVFITNNSARTPEQVAAKLEAMGIAASPSEVMTSGLATAELLAGRGGGSAFVVGQDGLRSALEDAGMQIVDGEPDRTDYVVVGLDESADYTKLKRASLLVERGAALVASNPDRAFPSNDGMWPGAGALLAVITTTTGASAEIVGKPYAPLFEMARRRAGDGFPLVVGDLLDTDIAGAAGLGWDSLLVLSGASTRADLDGSQVRPTFIAQDVSALLEEAKTQLENGP